MPIAVAGRRLTLHRTWQHPRWPSSGPRRPTSLWGLLLQHENTVPASTECDPLHRRSWPCSINTVDRMSQLATRPVPAEFVGLRQHARGRARGGGRRRKSLRSSRSRTIPGNHFLCAVVQRKKMHMNFSHCALYRRELLLRMPVITLDNTAGTCHRSCLLPSSERHQRRSNS